MTSATFASILLSPSAIELVFSDKVLVKSPFSPEYPLGLSLVASEYSLLSLELFGAEIKINIFAKCI